MITPSKGLELYLRLDFDSASALCNVMRRELPGVRVSHRPLHQWEIPLNCSRGNVLPPFSILMEICVGKSFGCVLEEEHHFIYKSAFVLVMLTQCMAIVHRQSLSNLMCRDMDAHLFGICRNPISLLMLVAAFGEWKCTLLREAKPGGFQTRVFPTFRERSRLCRGPFRDCSS